MLKTDHSPRPYKPPQLKAPFAFSPCAQAPGIFVGPGSPSCLQEYLGTCFICCFDPMHGSHQLQIPSQPPTSVHPLGSPSVCTASAGFPPCRSGPCPFSLGHACGHPQPYPSLPSGPRVSGASWSPSLQSRIEPLRDIHTLTSLVWTQTHHFNGLCGSCQWAIWCLLREKAPLLRSWTE